MVSVSASEPGGREFHPGQCSYSVFAMSLQCSLLQARPMVTSRFALTCCKLVSHLHTCRDKFAESLQTNIAIWNSGRRGFSRKTRDSKWKLKYAYYDESGSN
ncbi:hypothetical protein AVEN_34901-1 [Araneus ventricosus]|uniref:Uncharacterized protein n=1 Tax=Araneus ventricosus TaxID=182803 RepID=A0A4Y2PJS3_ARAVE|nr:hypothetical protein AVEN_34901-1 [Araneus ventricosus]